MPKTWGGGSLQAEEDREERRPVAAAAASLAEEAKRRASEAAKGVADALPVSRGSGGAASHESALRSDDTCRTSPTCGCATWAHDLQRSHDPGASAKFLQRIDEH